MAKKGIYYAVVDFVHGAASYTKGQEVEMEDPNLAEKLIAKGLLSPDPPAHDDEASGPAGKSRGKTNKPGEKK